MYCSGRSPWRWSGIAMPLIDSSEPPILIRISICGLLVVQIIDTPKLRLAGERTRFGGVAAGDAPTTEPAPSPHNPPITSSNYLFTVAPAGFGLSPTALQFAPLCPGLKIKPRPPRGRNVRGAVVVGSEISGDEFSGIAVSASTKL